MNPNTFTLTIGDSDNIIINSDWTIMCSVPVYYEWKFRFIFCFTDTICNNYVPVKLEIHTVSQIQLGMRNGAITVDSKILQVQETALSWSGCNVPGWVKLNLK